jgi:hypothetical protein
MLEIWCKFALVSNFIIYILISKAKDMLYRYILLRKFIISFSIKITRWGFYLSFECYCSHFLLSNSLFILLLIFFIYLLEKIFIIYFIWIIFPYNYWFFLSSNAYNIVLLFIELNCSNLIGMSCKFIENRIFFTWIIE